MFSMFDGQGESGASCLSHDGARQEIDGAGTQQHRGPFPGISRGIAVRRYVRKKRLPPPPSLLPREKSAAAILTIVKRFIADMGLPRAFRSDNGTEYTNPLFVESCNNVGIRRELTASYTPQQTGPVGRAHSGERTKQDTRHVWETRASTRTPAWKKSRVLRTPRLLVCGWSHCFGPQSALTGRL